MCSECGGEFRGARGLQLLCEFLVFIVLIIAE